MTPASRATLPVMIVTPVPVVVRGGVYAFDEFELDVPGFELRRAGSSIPLEPQVFEVLAFLVQNAGRALSKQELLDHVWPERYVTEAVGLPTLNDILSELAKPGRDPRRQFEVFAFQEGVDKIEDLRPGMKLPGVVTNVTAFGAFVDIGVHQDGLVHISQLADRFVKSPAEVVKVQQKVMVTVTEVDLPRKRIALSMKANPELGPRSAAAPSARKDASPPPAKPPGPKPVDWFTEALNKSARR